MKNLRRRPARHISFPRTLNSRIWNINLYLTLRVYP
jgi:hypothetical protein